MSRNQLTSCISCSKDTSYLWSEEDPMPIPGSVNIEAACRVNIKADYGSSMAPNEFYGIICDDCVEVLLTDGKLLQKP